MNQAEACTLVTIMEAVATAGNLCSLNGLVVGKALLSVQVLLDSGIISCHNNVDSTNPSPIFHLEVWHAVFHDMDAGVVAVSEFDARL